MNNLENRVTKDIEPYARQVVKNALDLRRQLVRRPLNDRGKQYLKIVDDAARYVMRGLADPAQRAIETTDEHGPTNFQAEVGVLALLISDPCETLHEVFAVDAAEVDYGIKFCEEGIRKLEAKGALDPQSPEHTQLQNYRVLLKRFSAEKERGVAPTYNPTTFKQFA